VAGQKHLLQEFLPVHPEAPVFSPPNLDAAITTFSLQHGENNWSSNRGDTPTPSLLLDGKLPLFSKDLFF